MSAPVLRTVGSGETKRNVPLKGYSFQPQTGMTSFPTLVYTM